MSMLPGIPGLRIGSIVIHCYEFERMLAFWQAALGYVPKYPPEDDWALLHNPAGRGPNLSLARARAPRTGKRSWLHLDLYAQDAPAEIERLVALGASRYPWRYPPGADYTVLEDPDGNLFCIIQDVPRS